MINRINTPLVASAVTASLVGLLLIWRLSKRMKVYVKVAKVKKLIFYPFKSLKAIELDEIQIGNTGVQVNGITDRTFMLVDGKGNMVTRTPEPSLVFLNLKVSGKGLVITAKDMEPLNLSIKDNISSNDKIISCSVIADSVKGVDCGDDAAAWFNKYLKRTDIRVVQCSETLEKRLKRGARTDIFFQNKNAVHVVSASSIEELNKRLDEPVSELNFRPNILVEDCPPFAEDDWKFLSFPSGTELEVSGPCNRCASTTVNSVTGVRTDKEPLKSMRKFRIPEDPALAKEFKYSPCFGILCGVKKSGNVHVGDDLYAVVEKGLYKYVIKS